MQTSLAASSALRETASDEIRRAIAEVIAAGREASARGWVPATSGNFSARIDGETIAVTRSGADKGNLVAADVLVQPLAAPAIPGSSAETPLHIHLYRGDPAIAAVLHTHSPASTVIGRARLAAGAARFTGWELQKALAGVRSHEAIIELPVFANDQDTVALAAQVAARFAELPAEGTIRAPGYLIAGHGIYAWGRSAAEAARHLEALEVLCAQTLAFAGYAQSLGTAP